MVELNIAGVNDRYGQGEAKTFRDLLNGRLYRAKYRIPRTQALSAWEITARRKQIAQKTRPWEHAPTYRRAHERDGKAPPEPEAQAPREATQAPTAEAPVSPKRERKSAPKKTSGKKNTQG